MQAFMLVDPNVKLRKADFAADLDSLSCDFHVRLRMSKNDVEQLLKSGWNVTDVPSDPNNDSSWVQSKIGAAVNWDYIPRKAGDVNIVNQSATGPNESAQGIIRQTPGGYVVFIDRKVPSSAATPSVRTTMAIGACDTAFVSQAELDFRSWTGSPSPATDQE